jgi:hypothetical protein
MKMGVPKNLANVRAIMALGVWCAAMATSPSASVPTPYQAVTAADLSGIEDVAEQKGPFAMGEQNYTVLLHEKRLAAAADPLLAQTLVGLEIRDAAGNVAYEKNFPLAIAAARFQQSVSASVERLSGNTGAGLMIHYAEQAAANRSGQQQSNEFWQLFGLVNGKLAALGRPAIIGEPGAGGPYMGVVMRAANGTVSVINQPDAMEVRAWTGNFYVFVPLRVDWNHGGLAQGQRCMEMLGGGLREVGCDMRVQATRKPSAEEFTFVRLFTEAHDNPEAAEHVVLQKDSKVEILGSSAITTWNETGGLIQPVFTDVWLHVRVDNRAGWIHGEDDFAAVGLPTGSPAP